MGEPNRKVAIFHDYFRVIGGAEKLVLTLARDLKVDVIASEVDRKNIRRAGFEDVKIIALGKLSKHAFLLPNICRKRFSNCRFNYDKYIFSGTFSIYASKKHKPNIWYCHTPLRGLYDLHDVKKTNYSRIVNLKNQIIPFEIVPKAIGSLIDTFFNGINIIKEVSNDTSAVKTKSFRNTIKKIKQYLIILRIIVKLRNYEITRNADSKAVNNINNIVANSKNVQNRIKKYYHRKSVVIYPPINTTDFKYLPPENYWLSVNRLTPEKRVHLQIEAFRKMKNENLIIVGGKGDNKTYLKNLFKNVPRNVKFLDFMSEKELIKIYARCKGIIATAKDEDFGMTLVEAMASGKPVIASNEGGYKESVINGKTGLLINNISTSKIIEAINTVEENKVACTDRAKKFDISIFMKMMRKEVDKLQ